MADTVILVVEDETAISNLISDILTVNQYDVIKATTGREALSLATYYSPDLILLDLGLPDIDGLEVISTIRRISNVPIIVVSKRCHERNKVEALDLGADDYITKPFGSSELLARIRTELRHSRQGKKADIKKDEKMINGDVTIDPKKRTLMVRGKQIHLTPNEYKIMFLLFQNIGKVLTHDYIIKEIWGYHYLKDNQILRVNMMNIRRKIEIDPTQPEYILTDSGIGYIMPEK